jgi:hypothetical protein
MLAWAAGVGEAGVGDLVVEVLAHLVFVDHFADRDPGLVHPGQGATCDPRGDLAERLLGGGQQVVRFAALSAANSGLRPATSRPSG